MTNNKFGNLIKKHKILLSYAVFGVWTTVVNVGVYILLSHFFGTALYQLWNVIAWVAAVLYSFIVNKKYVFKSKKSTKKEAGREFYGFIKGRLLSLVAEVVILFVFVSVLGLNDKIVKIFSNIVVVAINYFYARKRVFNK